MDDLPFDFVDRLLLCVMLGLIWLLFVILSIEIDKNERRLEQLEQMHEQLEEIKDSA